MGKGKKASRQVSDMRFQDGVLTPSHRNVPEEVPIAFSYGGSTHAVMMASPADLEDFALGFSLAEGIVRSADEIVAIEPVETDKGIDVQIRLKDATADALVARRRRMAGPVGCGLCGIESIDQAMRPVTAVTDPGWRLTPQMIREAMAELASRQALNHETRAVHAAGFYLAGVEPGLVALREDVGRHNALDKLSGAVLRGGWKGADGMVVVTSRLSVEMVQKTALLGAPVLAAISAPTALAIEVAEASGITLIGIARDRDFEVFVRPDRLDIDRSADRLDVLKRQMNG